MSQLDNAVGCYQHHCAGYGDEQDADEAKAELAELRKLIGDMEGFLEFSSVLFQDADRGYPESIYTSRADRLLTRIRKLRMEEGDDEFT
jgi:hypothetical protein